MPQILFLFVIFIIGLLTGFLDSTVGSGGLVSIPMLIFLGIPPQMAIATDRFGTVGQSLGAFSSFWKAKKVVWAYVPIFAVLALIGSYIGAQLLVHIHAQNLQKIIGIILLLVLPLVIFQKQAGIQRSTTSLLKRLFGCSIYFLVMIYNGFFGTGAGPLSLYNQITFFGFTIIEANATSTIPSFVLAISSLIIFAQHNIVNVSYGITLLIGMTAGGYIGAHSLLKMGNMWVKRLFIVVIVISAARLLLF